MKIVARCAFASALLGLAQACANPVDVQGCAQNNVSSNCDVILAAASDFAPGDAGAMAGQSGATGTDLNGPTGSAGAGGSSSAELGTAGATALQPGQGGTSNGSQSGTGVGAAGTGSAGTGSAGAGGGGGGGTAGTGSAGAGGGVAAGGTAGTGAAGTTGTGTTVTINPADCDFTDTTGCEQLACATACPTNMGTYCADNCPPIVDCVEKATPLCVTAADPLCAKRTNGTANTCTTLVENGGNQTNPTQPAAVALGFIQCMCAATRP